MVTLPELWLPILVASVLVFALSSIIHMALPYHRSDFKGLPDEDRLLAALSDFSIPPGDYSFPHATSSKAMSDPGFMEKFNRGPVGFATFAAPGQFNMGKSLGMWFVYILLITILAAYACSRAIGPTSDYANVFQIVGTVAITGYAFGRWQQFGHLEIRGAHRFHHGFAVPPLHIAHGALAAFTKCRHTAAGGLLALLFGQRANAFSQQTPEHRTVARPAPHPSTHSVALHHPLPLLHTRTTLRRWAGRIRLGRLTARRDDQREHRSHDSNLHFPIPSHGWC